VLLSVFKMYSVSITPSPFLSRQEIGSDGAPVQFVPVFTPTA
jgi:hypothetical protein